MRNAKVRPAACWLEPLGASASVQCATTMISASLEASSRTFWPRYWKYSKALLQTTA